MGFVYLNLNGDEIGENIGNAVASNDEEGLGQMSNTLKDAHRAFEEWIESVGGMVIVSSGDESLCKIPAEAYNEETIEGLRQQYEQMTGHTATVGVGNSMSEAAKALIYGKMNEKNQVVQYDPMIEDYINSDEEASEQVEDIVSAEGQAGGQAEGQAEGQAGGYPVDEEFQNNNIAQNSPDESTQSQMPDESLMDEGQMSEEDASVSPEDKLKQFVAADVDGDGDIDDVAEVSDQDGDGDIDQEDASSLVSDMIHANMGGDEDQEMEGQEMEGQEMGEEELDEEEISQAIQELSQEDLAEGHSFEDEEQSEEGMDDQLKQDIMNSLSAFKDNQQMLEQAKEQNPSLYSATITMLRAMIEMAKRLSVNPAPELEEGMEEDLDQMGDEGQMPEQEMSGEEEMLMEDEDSAYDKPFSGEEGTEESTEEGMEEESEEPTEEMEEESEEPKKENKKPAFMKNEEMNKQEKGVNTNLVSQDAMKNKGESDAGRNVRRAAKFKKIGLHDVAKEQKNAAKRFGKWALDDLKSQKKPNLPKSEEASSSKK